MHVVRDHEVPCPECGYDLRAAVTQGAGVRCPECGVVSSGQERSRIPWAHRRRKGTIKSYWRTLWMVLRQPSVLANETRKRLVARDAKSFERVSLAIGAVVGTVLIGVAFWLVLPNFWNLPEPYFTPVYVLTDSVWALAILAVGLYVSAWLGMQCYRWMMRIGMRGIERRRCGRVMRYASAIWVAEAMLLGLMVLIVVAGEIRISDYMEISPAIVTLMPMVLAIAVYLWPTMVIVANTGRWKWFRAGMLAVGFPVVFAAVFIGVTFVLFWSCGYVALAVGSMWH